MKRRIKLGQHYLVDKDVLADIISYAAIKAGDKIIEIGPGKGVLTEELLKKGAKVTAVEIDEKLVEILCRRFVDNKDLEIINQDILDFISDSYLAKPDLAPPDKLIGNIPYQITSPLLRKIFKLDNQPELIIFMVQKEVAERIVALPGDSKRGFLSVLVQYYGKPEIIKIVPKEAFYPRPRVESAIIKIVSRKQKTVNSNFFKIVQAGFSQKRKKIRNSIAASFQIKAADAQKLIEKALVNPDSRAEDLKISEWFRLLKYFSKFFN